MSDLIKDVAKQMANEMTQKLNGELLQSFTTTKSTGQGCAELTLISLMEAYEELKKRPPVLRRIECAPDSIDRIQPLVRQEQKLDDRTVFGISFNAVPVYYDDTQRGTFVCVFTDGSRKTYETGSGKLISESCPELDEMAEAAAREALGG